MGIVVGIDDSAKLLLLAVSKATAARAALPAAIGSTPSSSSCRQRRASTRASASERVCTGPRPR